MFNKVYLVFVRWVTVRRSYSNHTRHQHQFETMFSNADANRFFLQNANENSLRAFLRRHNA